MRLASATSVLLVVVLAALAPNCVAGWSGQPAAACSRPGFHRTCAGEKSGADQAMHPVCHRALKSQADSCGLRSFVQSQFATFRSASLAILLQPRIGNIAPARSVIIVSSIGSSETDRGPPRS